MKPTQDDLTDDWRALGVQPSRRKAAPEPVLPDPERVLLWLAGHGDDDVYLTVPGGSPQARAGFYNAIDCGTWTVERSNPRAWLTEGPLDDLTRRIGRLEPLTGGTGDWAWLRALAATKDFLIEEPLRTMVDNQVYLIHDAMLILLALRFAILEGQDDPDLLFRAFIQWLRGEGLEPEQRRLLHATGITKLVTGFAGRVDLLFFLLALAFMNDVLDRTVFVFDDLEGACSPGSPVFLRELHSILGLATRWSRATDFPGTFLLGFDPRRQALLRRLAPKFAEDVQVSMEWAKVP